MSVQNRIEMGRNFSQKGLQLYFVSWHHLKPSRVIQDVCFTITIEWNCQSWAQLKDFP